MPTVPRFHLVWMLVNLIGIAFFLAMASQSWIEPELAGIPGASAGDAFVWFALAVPVLLVFSLCNLLWLGAAITERLCPLIGTLAIGALIGGCWVAAYLFDNAHHGM
jgi:hypothetical protein